jgi:uncharacterized protein (TIGR03790 family)
MARCAGSPYRPMMRFRLAVLLLFGSASAALAGVGPAETVVLVNVASPDSRRVAEHFLVKREIPPQQVCEVKCTTELEVPMQDFVRDVVDPLRAFLKSRELEGRTTVVVLTQGMPILARTPGGAVSTAAALGVLHSSTCGQDQTRLPGIVNPYQNGPAPTDPMYSETRLLLVTALVSSTAEEAMALVDRSVASDGTAPADARFVYQDADGPADRRNGSYDTQRKRLEDLKFTAEHQPSGADKVKDRKKVMGYMSGGSYSGLTVESVKSNEHLPGAICDMLESFGAVPANFGADASKHQQFPVTHMVRAGFTGVHGAVAEPYAHTFPRSDLFNVYAEGFTLAEAFHQRLPNLYWMNLTLGDPLCAPYAKRPIPTAELAGGDGGKFEVRVAAPTATRIDVYANGRALGSVDGEKGSVALDLSTVPEAKELRVLVEATGQGKTQPRGWKTVSKPWESTWPHAPHAAAAPRCEKLLVQAPETLTAGDAATLKLTAADAAGKPLAQWKGRIEVRSATPPVRWAYADAESSSVEIPLTMTKAADLELVAVAGDEKCGAPFKVRVAPGSFAHVTTPLETFPLCQDWDMELVAEDAFGNRLPDWSGTVVASVMDDRYAVVPPALAITGGRGVLRGVLITHEGPTPLVFKDESGDLLSDQREMVDVKETALRTWILSGPLPAAELAGDPSAAVTGDGSVLAKTLLRRRASPGDVVALPSGGEAVLAVTWVESLGATKARLCAAGPARLRVLLDGKQIFDGAPKAADAAGKREPLCELDLAAGTHRLAVVADTKSGTTVSLAIDDGKGKFPPTIRVRARQTEAPKRYAVSGRVLRKDGAALAGAKVTVKVADVEKEAVSAADGTWWIDDLPGGEATIRAAAQGVEFAEPERTLQIEDRNAVDVDFAAKQ